MFPFEWLAQHRVHFFILACLTGLLAVLGYLRSDLFFENVYDTGRRNITSPIDQKLDLSEVSSNPTEQNHFPDILDFEEELEKFNSSYKTCKAPEKNATTSWTFTYPAKKSHGDVKTESNDFKAWAADFFPRAAPRLSDKENFLEKVVGLRKESVCFRPTDDLDFSAGWLDRTVMYLYQSNKTRVDCHPYSHSSNDTRLTVLNGTALHDHLNATAGEKICTVVFFFAGSCPYSRRAAPLMHSAAVYFPNLRFVAVNTDKYPGVAGHYGIMGVPVVVLFQEKKFLTGWTIPYPDARDTIRAFIMAYTDAKYIPVWQNITDLESGIMTHFNLRKQYDLLYILSYWILLTAVIITFWKSYLIDAIKKSLDRAGLTDEHFVMGLQQPIQPAMDPQIPVPLLEA